MKIREWLNESNRKKHLVGVFLLSLFGTALMGIGAIIGMKFKDCHHSYGNANKPIREWNWSAWDWNDVWAGLIGCLCGIIVHINIAFFCIIIWKYFFWK